MVRYVQPLACFQSITLQLDALSFACIISAGKIKRATMSLFDNYSTTIPIQTASSKKTIELKQEHCSEALQLQ